MNKESLKRQFLMRHMPNALNGYESDAFRSYYQEIRDSAVDGYYESNKFKNLAYDFFDGRVDNPREMVSYVFGTGANKFWCFEHNLIDYPMVDFKTIFDIVVELDNIKEKLLSEDDSHPYTHTPDYNFYNLWCCTSEPFENIIINSFPMELSFHSSSRGSKWMRELCNKKDEYEGELMVDQDGMYVDTSYFDSEVDKLVYSKMLKERGDIDQTFIKQVTDIVCEKHPNTIFKTLTDTDVVCYVFVNPEDAKRVNLETFFDDINTFNVFNYEVTENSDGDDVWNGIDVEMRLLEDEWKQAYVSLYESLHEKISHDFECGIVPIPEKTMKVNLSNLLD